MLVAGTLPARLAPMSLFGRTGNPFPGFVRDRGLEASSISQSKTVIYGYYSGAYFGPEYRRHSNNCEYTCHGHCYRHLHCHYAFRVRLLPGQRSTRERHRHLHCPGRITQLRQPVHL